MYEGVDTIVLFEELAYHDVMPVAWRPLNSPVNGALVASFADKNLRVLQSLAALEEHGQLEKADETHPHSADLMRLDMKLNLLIDMVGQLLIANQARPQAVPVRFNALGASWKGIPPHPQLGSTGVFEVYVRNSIVEPLRFVGTIAQVTSEGAIRAKFNPPGEQIADLIKKLAFRRHRRQVAEAKHPKK